MKQIKKNILTIGLMLSLVYVLSSCNDFLNRPTVDGYNVDNFYQNDDQCFQAVDILYGAPWYDMMRFFISAGERTSGNIYDSGAYGTFTVSSGDGSLSLASQALWAVNANANGIIQNIDMKSSPQVTQTTKNTVKGEALVWKAMAYFYLVRTFGAVPIIHDNAAMIAAANYADVRKATITNVYDYIVMVLNKAIEWLPEKNQRGRLDRYCAYALLSKVYLYKSGCDGENKTRNQEDLDNAAKYAKIVIDQSGRKLMPNYEDIFRFHNNVSDESLIAWLWISDPVWTSQNSLQSDLAVDQFSGFDDNWGYWTAVSADLQDAFGETPLSKTRNNHDLRRHATMMMYGDHYDYFWRDKGGFDWTSHVMGTLIGGKVQKDLNGTASNCVKHLIGNQADQVGEGGPANMDKMRNGLATHLLRLADVYLIYAEAKIGNAASTSDASALAAFNAVHSRAVPSDPQKTSITWEDVWKERRLELAIEGDRWYDYVRWSYYDSDAAIAELKNQRRAGYSGLKAFYQSGSTTPDTNTTYYDKEPKPLNPGQMYDSKLKSFVFPYPDKDVIANPHLLEDPVEQDISQYKY